MNTMDPDFAKLPYQEQNKVFEDAYRRYGVEKPKPVVEAEMRRLQTPQPFLAPKPAPQAPSFAGPELPQGGASPFSNPPTAALPASGIQTPVDEFHAAPPPTVGQADALFNQAAHPAAFLAATRAEPVSRFTLRRRWSELREQEHANG